jgi:hypothetical protein
MKAKLHFRSHLAQFFLERECFRQICIENQNTHFMFSEFSFEILALCEIIWKNIVEQDRSQMTKRRMRLTFWTLKAADTHSEYVILNAFPLQLCLHESATILRYTYIACAVTHPS